MEVLLDGTSKNLFIFLLFLIYQVFLPFPTCLKSNNWVSEAADGGKLSPFLRELLSEGLSFPI